MALEMALDARCPACHPGNLARHRLPKTLAARRTEPRHQVSLVTQFKDARGTGEDREICDGLAPNLDAIGQRTRLTNSRHNNCRGDRCSNEEVIVLGQEHDVAVG